MPDKDFLKEVSAQLRKPHGELGIEVAKRMNESNRAMNLETIHALGIKDHHTALEIGMGNGFFVKDILSLAEGVSYIGCDYSQDMVKLSTSLNSKFIDAGQASFHLSEAHHLPTDNNSIDHLFTVNTIYFWKDIPSIFSEFKRVLKEDGNVAIAIRPKGCLSQFPSAQYYFEYYTTKQVSKLLVDHGFSVSMMIEKTETEMDVMGKTLAPQYAVIVATVNA